MIFKLLISEPQHITTELNIQAGGTDLLYANFKRYSYYIVDLILIKR